MLLCISSFSNSSTSLLCTDFQTPFWSASGSLNYDDMVQEKILRDIFGTINMVFRVHQHNKHLFTLNSRYQKVLLTIENITTSVTFTYLKCRGQYIQDDIFT
jgi:hypothetical protein